MNIGGEDIGLGGGTALRVNAIYHDADTPGRDHVETHRIGIAPSIAVGLGTSTRAILSYFRLQQDNVPDYGIPFVPTPTPARWPTFATSRRRSITTIITACWNATTTRRRPISPPSRSSMT